MGSWSRILRSRGIGPGKGHFGPADEVESVRRVFEFTCKCCQERVVESIYNPSSETTLCTACYSYCPVGLPCEKSPTEAEFEAYRRSILMKLKEERRASRMRGHSRGTASRGPS